MSYELDKRYEVTRGSQADIAKQKGQTLARTFMDADAVVLVDMSYSMTVTDAPGRRSRYDAAEEELRRLQEELPGKVAVIAFSSTVEYCPGGVPPRLGGGTDMTKALEFIKPVDGCGIQIVLISDGEPDNEITTLSMASKFQDPISVVYIGSEMGRGRDFLKRLADATGGKALKSNQPGLLKAATKHLLLEAK